MWEIFKVFIEFSVILFLFYVLFFWAQTCELLTPWPGVSPAPPALESKVLTPGMPGRSHEGRFGFLFNFLFILGYSRLASSVEISSSEQGRDSAVHRRAPILPQPPPIQAPSVIQRASSRWAELHVPCGRALLVIHFKYITGSVYKPIPHCLTLQGHFEPQLFIEYFTETWNFRKYEGLAQLLGMYSLFLFRNMMNHLIIQVRSVHSLSPSSAPKKL